jgi:hypothetical protein
VTREWGDLKDFRFPKDYTNSLMDGGLYLVRRGVDFPEVMADADIRRRLRNSAYYRKTTIMLTSTPDGVLIQARAAGDRSPLELDALSTQLFQALQRNDDLEEVLREVSRALEGQVRELTTRLNGLEVELMIQKEELSTLAMRS